MSLRAMQIPDHPRGHHGELLPFQAASAAQEAAAGSVEATSLALVPLTDDSGPVVRIQIRESILRQCFRLDTLERDQKTVALDGPVSTSPVLKRLSKALNHAGVEVQDNVENALRLAVVASLFRLDAHLQTVAKEHRPPSGLPKWRLKRVLEYIEANISERITLADLAAAAGMSRMYFASQFRAATGVRPHHFVLSKRIERAQTLLQTTSDTLVDIALSVGFQTQAHFTTVFKKFVGATPYQWRSAQKGSA